MLRKACEALAEVRPVDTEELIDLSDAINAYVDELAAASTDGFALQLREQAGEGDRRRRQLAELLLRGSAPDSVVAAAAAAIGWRALDTVVPGRAAARTRRATPGSGTARTASWSSASATRCCCCGPGRAPTRAQLTEALHGRGAVVGPALGWAQVPEGVRLAELTAELVRAPARSRSSPTTTSASLALQGEPGALAVLSARRLAPLAARPGQPSGRRLLETLHSWLLHWGSRAEVVRRAVRAPADGELPPQAPARAARRRPGRPGRPVRAPAGPGLPRPLGRR